MEAHISPVHMQATKTSSNKLIAGADMRLDSCSSALSDTESYDETDSIISTEKDETQSADESENSGKFHGTSMAKIPKTRRNKKKSLPGFPQKSQPAFFFWLNENRTNIKEKFSDLNTEEFFKKSNELWNELEDKSKWMKEAIADRKRYDRELAKWNVKEKKRMLKIDNLKLSESSRFSSPVKSPRDVSFNNMSSGNSESEAFYRWYGSGSAFKSKEFIDTTHGSSSMDEQSQCGNDETSEMNKSNGYI